MCGIAGFINIRGKAANPSDLVRMTDIQKHRGPDDQGFAMFSLRRGKYVDYRRGETVSGEFEGGVGFNRLSILDLSTNGHQPMANATGDIVIAFNGEVYNAFDFRPQLEAAGFKFRSRTDTEVLLYLYEHYGLEGMLERANGMFAIVIVDLRKQELHLVRDHLGIKPFYWALQKDTLYFSSEVKSFFVHPDFTRELDADNVDEYAAFRYCAGDRHLLKGVRQLRPGHRLEFTDRGLKVMRYWCPPPIEVQGNRSFSEALDEFSAKLEGSVRSQLLSDVKVGCQLSGGIDSSMVTLMARRQCGADMDSFSIIFKDPKFSEEPWISEAASVAGVDSHRYFFSEDSFFENVEKAAWHLDQPLNHPNSLGIYLLSAKASRLVTVLLSGEGADELLGGYPRFYHAAIRPRIKGLHGIAETLPYAGPRIRRDLGRASEDPVSHFIGSSAFDHLARVPEIRPDFEYKRVLEGRKAIFDEGDGSHLSRCLTYEMQTYLADLLVRQDKMTMASSMENRVPFLDRDLVSFVRTLPESFLIGSKIYRRDTRVRNTKVILKELASRSFSPSFVHRHKSGFPLPLSTYFRNPAFDSWMREKLLPGIKRRGLFSAKGLEKWWSGRTSITEDVREALWIVLSFEIWAQKVVDERFVATS